jgi:hypothetical protein
MCVVYSLGWALVSDVEALKDIFLECLQDLASQLFILVIVITERMMAISSVEHLKTSRSSGFPQIFFFPVLRPNVMSIENLEAPKISHLIHLTFRNPASPPSSDDSPAISSWDVSTDRKPIPQFSISLLSFIANLQYLLCGGEDSFSSRPLNVASILKHQRGPRLSVNGNDGQSQPPTPSRLPSIHGC